MSNTKTWLQVATVVAGIWGICASGAGENAPAAALSPEDILAMAKNLRGTDAAVKSARLALVRRIEADYLSDTAATQRVPPRQWREMVFLFVGDLSPDARSAWIAKLRSAFVSSPEVVPPARAGDVVALVEALRRLGDADTAGLPRVFDEAWDARNKQAALSGADCEAIRAVWCLLGQQALARKWAAREYDALVGTAEARSAIDLRGLAGLARVLSVTGMTGKDKAYPEFAATVLRLARDGTLGPADSLLLRDLRGPLEADETRKLLEAGLADLQGNARPALLVVLMWAYRNAGELDVWRQFIEDKVGSSEGDTKALWLVAKANTMMLLPDPPNPLRRRRGLEDALAAALSEPVRLAVLREFVDYYRAINRPAVGVQMLQSLKHQFSGEAAETIGAMQAGLQDAEAARQARNARAQSAAEIVRNEARLKYYQACLERARTEGEQEEVARLRAAITALEREMNR